MSASARERRTRIVDTVRETGPVRVVDLAERLGVPAVTVRRDVAALAEAGELARTHGSVFLPADTARGADRPVRLIGMMVPTETLYFDEVIAGARQAAAAVGARVVLGIAPYGEGSDRAQTERLLESGADGLLLTPNWTPEEGLAGEDWLGSLPVPAVLVERQAAPASAAAALDTVVSNHRRGVVLALSHLVARGHRSVLLAARSDTCTAHEVRAGYAATVRELGLPELPLIDVPDQGVAAPGPDGVSAAERIAAAAGPAVRALLVHNDHEAIQLPSLLRAHGLSVPDDLAIVSYDDVYAELSQPQLTAVAPPRRAVGAEAVALLVRRLDAEEAFPVHRIGLDPELRVRQS